MRQTEYEEIQSSQMREISRKFSCHPQSDQHKLRHVGEEVSLGITRRDHMENIETQQH